jgi:hypothetical protein
MDLREQTRASSRLTGSHHSRAMLIAARSSEDLLLLKCNRKRTLKYTCAFAARLC